MILGAVALAGGFLWGSSSSFLGDPVEVHVESSRSEILNDKTRQEHIELNRGLLEDQARNFYTGIIHAIDDDARLQFKFR